MLRNLLVLIFLFSGLWLIAQTWQVASKNGCGIDGYLTYVKKDSGYDIGYLADYELRFERGFFISDTILQFTMLNENEQRFSTTNNINNFFILTDKYLYRCVAERDAGSGEMTTFVIADSLAKDFDYVIPLSDNEPIHDINTVVATQIGDSTYYQVYDWAADSMIAGQWLRGHRLDYYFEQFDDRLTILQNTQSTTWLHFLNLPSLTVKYEFGLPYRFYEPTAISHYVDDVQVLGKIDSGYAGVFYQRKQDSIVNTAILPVDTICNFASDGSMQRFFIIGKHEDSSGIALSEVSFNDFSIHHRIDLKCVENLENSTPTGFNMAKPLTLSFNFPGDSNIYFLPSLYNIQIDSIKTEGTPGKVLGTWGCYVGVEKREAELLSIQAFPNPADNQLHIILAHLAAGEKYLFEIFDMEGKRLFHKRVAAKENFQINTADFPKGMLILKLHGKQLVRTRKVIHQ